MKGIQGGGGRHESYEEGLSINPKSSIDVLSKAQEEY